jgi:RNA polymerase sigma-70 factor (ECF subfamily)
VKTGKLLSWESHLVRRAVQGEAVAFELLIDTYRPMLLNLAGRMLRNTDDANDAVQETFVKAFRAIREFDPERPLKPWLCRICTNCCVDTVRNRRREGDPLEDHEHTLQDPRECIHERAGGAIRQGQLMEAIERLPEKYRKIIFMRHFKHMEVNEIATELNKPEGTIKSLLFRARAMLKKDLRLALG